MSTNGGLTSVIALSENIKKEEATAIISDVNSDLRWTHFQPSAQALSHHCSSLLTVGKTQALTVCGWWHLVREMQYALDTIQSVSSGLVCVRSFLNVYLSSVVCVSIDAAERQKEESLSGIAQRWAGTPSDKHTSLEAYLPD